MDKEQLEQLHDMLSKFIATLPERFRNTTLDVMEKVNCAIDELDGVPLE